MRQSSILLSALFIICAVLPTGAKAQDDPDIWSTYRLWYEAPAPAWDEALPIGNGRLGAMIFGDTARERIQFNEETLWSGGPYDPTVDGASWALPEIQRLLFEGDFARAHDLFGRSMMGVPYEQMKYQPTGDLWIEFPGHEQVEDYRRVLDLDRAIVTVSYRVGDVTYKREIFSTAVDQVIVVRITADRPGAVSFSARLHGVRNPAHSNYGTDYFRMQGLPPNSLQITGKSSDYLGIEGRVRYEARLVAQSEGGSVNVDYRTLRVEGADSATLLIAAATNFNSYRDVTGNPSTRVDEVLRAVQERDYDDLRNAHIKEHRNWFRRLSIDLGSDEAYDLPTDERIARLSDGADPQLAALYYQFGRYLLIASSRPGTQAANLQGIWNEDSNPSWDSKYTVNINLPMNYWPAEVGNLGELVEPLERFLNDVSETGRSVAQEHWGADGWVLHQNSDIWRATAPMDGPSWGAWPMGGVWLSTHLAEKYRFEGDDAFLERVYPILRGAVHFISDILVEHPSLGWLVTAPSNSPENFPAWQGNDRFFDEISGLFLKARTMAVGPTMDMQLIRQIYDDFIEISEKLDRDEELRSLVTEQQKLLAPNQIGKHGQLQEWIEDFDEVEPKHRHLSHLWGVYPGNEITPLKTPDLAEAAAVSIRRRGTGGCGWSYGWKIALWARLYEAAPALHEFKALLLDSSLSNLFSKCSRVLQVDGNFGATAGIAEMLLQSHEAALHFIPTLPDEWSSGRIQGMRARGGFEVGFAWENGALENATVISNLGRVLNIRSQTAMRVRIAQQEFETLLPENGIISFPTRLGETYHLEVVQ